MKKKNGTKVKLTGSKNELCKQYLKLKVDSPPKSWESPNAYGNSWEALSVKTDGNFNENKRIFGKKCSIRI